MATARPHKTKLDEFRRTYHPDLVDWYRATGLTPPTFYRIRAGLSDPRVSTARLIVIAARQLTGRRVIAQAIFDLGEDTPTKNVITPKSVPSSLRTSAKKYDTRLDRILRRERIAMNDFAGHVGIVRQTLLRLRTGQDEPCVTTLASIIRTLRQMTGKPYLARHLYDLGEET
jgi:predicted transcriptional regulator